MHGSSRTRLPALAANQSAMQGFAANASAFAALASNPAAFQAIAANPAAFSALASQPAAFQSDRGQPSAFRRSRPTRPPRSRCSQSGRRAGVASAACGDVANAAAFKALRQLGRDVRAFGE